MAAEIDVAPTAIVCKTASLTGRVRVCEGAIIHPRAVLRGEGGLLTLGADCIVEERAVLHCESEAGMTVGRGTLFRVGCDVAAERVGEGSVIGIRARVAAGATVGSGCVVGVGVSCEGEDAAEDGTALSIVAGRITKTVVPELKDEHLASITKVQAVLRDEEAYSYLPGKHDLLTWS
eukprot:PLAT13729.1.p1 GENE.PLAT13729.1~~PLAT13729.1.p1  ORF type:complete len:177 (+),score=37.17 PLAT13729.1:25-555(+)